MEIRAETLTKILKLFDEYINWLVMETGQLKHQLSIRKSFELLWKGYNFYTIDRMFDSGHINYRGELWIEYKNKYDEFVRK